MKNINEILEKDFSVLSKEEKCKIVSSLLIQIKQEIAHHDIGGMYGYLQRNMAFHSNRIEGNRLSIKDVTSLFETRALLSTGDTVYHAKDIEELDGHFYMFSQMLNSLDIDLSEKIIKSLHYQFEHNVFEFQANGYIPGEYKKKANTVGGIITSLPENVPMDMKHLLEDYQKIQNPKLEDLALFHAKFETIHPFQDGNGRTGRMILMRECLTHNIMPFLIQDENRQVYYDGLQAYRTNKDISILTEHFKSEQKDFYQHNFQVHQLIFLNEYEPKETISINERSDFDESTR